MFLILNHATAASQQIGRRLWGIKIKANVFVPPELGFLQELLTLATARAGLVWR
jgi:hypothetical protein